MKRVFALAMGMAFLCGGLASAADLGFENTADGIEKRLLTPGVVKTRSLDGALSSSEVRVRGLTVVSKPAGGETVVEKTVVVSKDKTGGFVNLAVRFDVDSYVLRAEAIPLLDELGKALSRPSLAARTMFVNGHADSDGTEDHNLRLSLNRAQAIKRYLTGNYAVPSVRLRVMGYGESVALVPNTSAENKQLNRRVEVVTAD